MVMLVMLLMVVMLRCRRLADLDLGRGRQRGRCGHVLIVRALDYCWGRRVRLGRVRGDHCSSAIDLHHVHLLRLQLHRFVCVVTGVIV